MNERFFIYDHDEGKLSEVKDIEWARNLVKKFERTVHIPSPNGIYGVYKISDALKLINEFLTYNPKYNNSFIYVVGIKFKDVAEYDAYIADEGEFGYGDPAFFPKSKQRQRIIKKLAQRITKRTLKRKRKVVQKKKKTTRRPKR